MARVLRVSEVERLDVDYDEEADVVYVSFGPPVAASDSAVLDNDIILHYKGEMHDRRNRAQLSEEAQGRATLRLMERAGTRRHSTDNWA